MVYNALKTHITNYKVTAAEAIQDAVKIAKTEIGYREKASNANLDSKTANAGPLIIQSIGGMLHRNTRVAMVCLLYKLGIYESL